MADSQPPGKNKPNPGAQSVRRKLFGRDPDKPMDDLAREREDLSQRQEDQFKKKWNFNISTDSPLEGKFEWTDCVPLNYRAPLLHVPKEEDSNASTSGRTPDGSSNNSLLTQLHTDSTLSRSLSSGDSSASATGSSNDDGTSSSPIQPFSSSSYIPSTKRQRSSLSGETTENQPGSKSPKR